MKVKLLHSARTRTVQWLFGFVLMWSVVCGAETVLPTPIHWRPVLIDQRLYWVGAQEPSTNDLAQVKDLVKAVGQSKPDAGMNLVEQFVNQNPGSGWIYSLKNVLAENYLKNAQFTAALETWESVWQATKQYSADQEGKRVADYALAHWTRLLASLGRFDTLTAVFQETKGRVLQHGPLEQRFLRTKEAYADMIRRPGISYRCGTLAMANVCFMLYGTNFNLRALSQIRSTTNGFALGQLEAFSQQLNLGLVPVRRPASADLIVPSVVNWKQHHYGAIVAFNHGRYKVVDPTMELPRYLTAAEIKNEASGYYFISSKQTDADCIPITQNEADTIYGKGNPNYINDSSDQPCTTCLCPIGPGPGSGPNCPRCFSSPPSGPGPIGMPQWGVSEPFINLWLQDEPLGYQPAYGPRVSFQLYYRSRVDSYAACSVGAGWSCEWLQPIQIWFDGGEMVLSLPGGGIASFENTDVGSYNYWNNYFMITTTNADGQVVHAEVRLPDGSKHIYDMQTNSDGTTEQILYLTREVDAQGNALTFNNQEIESYSHPLMSVVDATGLTNTLNWATDGYGDYYLTNIVDPFGRSVSLQMDPGSGDLTNLTDVAGLSISIAYESNGFVDDTPTNLTTPYGTTTFALPEVDERSMLVTEPTGGKHLYLFQFGTSQFGTYPSFPVPTNTPLNTLNTDDPGSENSYYWGPRQYDLLSSDFLGSWDVSQLTTNDFLRARIRHWLGSGEDYVYYATVDTISLEQDPSPDGNTLGQVTWYDYANKTNYFDPLDNQGTQILPAVTARVMPDGSTFYIWDQRDVWGHVTNEITHWFENGQDQFRTNTYVYSTNSFDILSVIGPDGITNAASSYDANHRILSNTNALGEVTRYSYDAYERLASIIDPNGLITTNIYGVDGFLAQQIDIGFATNAYTYSNALVYTYTDPRGLATTNTWDALNRLTSIAFPDGTYVSNCYTFLDLTATKDRLGNWTYFGYDPMRNKIAETNALGNTTLYSYCDCGSLESIQDAAGNSTLFYYDNAGRLTNTLYSDGYSVGRFYDSLDRVVKTADSSGDNITNNFNNYGSIVSVDNTAGQVTGYAYDVNDLVTNSMDANGVNVGMTYDNLHRLLTRSYPDTGIEKFGYTLKVSGPTSYTNQITNVVLYAYDAMNRKTNEVYVGVTTNQFAYSGAGDLLTLNDGKNQTTTWGYDSYGRVTNKVDALGTNIFVYKYDPDNRLTNRWSAAKTNTVYKYDAVGNLTNVVYPVSHAVSLNYDKLNRLTNMVDAVGTTVYGYDAAGQLLSENGPWANDTVSYTYANRLRMGLSLQAPNASAWSQGYGYDNARRLKNVTSPTGEFDYTLGGASSASPLIKTLSLPNSAYITNSYDNVARLLSTVLKNGGNTNLDSYAYGYNQANQRTNVVRTAGDYVNYTYDNVGELKTALGKESGGVTNRWQEQFGYNYDAAGNLNYRTNNALVQTFNVNSLNELTTINHTGTLTVAGTTTSPATNVTVNGASAVLYVDSTFASTNQNVVNVSLNTFTAIAKDIYGRMDTNTVNLFIPAHASYVYDLNGNLISEWSAAGGTNRLFSYDDENELTSVWVTNLWRTDFVYDGKMRRRIEKDFTWSGGAWLQTNEVHYIYDGNLVIQERDANNLPQVTYTRGNDLSGTLQGAGGIGGLLARTVNPSTLISQPSTSFYHADGNGNITMLISSSQMIVAKYLYDPFGNTLAQSGLLADANTYRFSSKEWNANSGLYYYLYRFYDPNLQRWPNHDPLGEFGFEIIRKRNVVKAKRTFPGIAELAERPDLYEFVRNRPISRVDLFGLQNSPYNSNNSFEPGGEGGQDEEGSVDYNPSNPFENPIGSGFALMGQWVGTAIACIINSVTAPIPPRPPQAPPVVGCSLCPVNSAPVSIHN
jgi:RHS repeat-associated protein